MSTIPYNYGKYIDDKVSMSNSGTVDAGRQAQSPASAGSRGLAKTTQFTKDPTQMKMGNSPIAESMVEIRNILNRIDGVNVPTNEINELADDDKIEFTKVMLDISQIKDRVEALSVDDEAKKSAIQSLTNAEEALVALDETAVREDAGLTDQQKKGLQILDKKYGKYEGYGNGGSIVIGNMEQVIDPGSTLWADDKEYNELDAYMKKMGYDGFEDAQDKDEDFFDNAMKEMPISSAMQDDIRKVLGNDYYEKPSLARAAKEYMHSLGESVAEDEDELARLKELSGIEEDTRTERRYTSDQIDQLKQWAKKYSQYKNIEGENLIEALYEYVFEMGIRQLAFEKGELQAAERKIGKAQEDWEDAEIEAAMEMSPISSGLMDDLENIIPGDVELEKKLDTIRTMLQKAGLKEDPYQPFPEEDEMTFEDDDAFYEAFGELGFPEDETELFDAEYRGRKVPLNKPMRGDVKKFKVYVKDPKTGNVKKVNFGHGGSSARKAGQKTMKIRKSNPKARKSFRARHNCANPGPKTRARYWSCRAW
jgi:hypothetical protein